jgi:hypothetical protein
MKNLSNWVTIAIINLSVVALLGVGLRTKLLFPVYFIDFKNLLSAHSHFAFGGWVTLILAALLIDKFLPHELKNKKIYQVILWGILICSYGMVFTFPFQGYDVLSIIFSTSFILFTYLFTWVFLRDGMKISLGRPVGLLVTCALLSLVISSFGPFRLAYMMATQTGTASQYRDAIYSFLHFQYNGFFTLAILALLFHGKTIILAEKHKKLLNAFAIMLCLSIFPSLFLSLLWHSYNPLIKGLSIVGCVLIIITVLLFTILLVQRTGLFKMENKWANALLFLTLLSFVVKMVLQTGTIIPALGKAVFEYRPIIIGFLHLVFLGMVTLFVFAYLIERGLFPVHSRAPRLALLFFILAILFNETVLLVNGIMLLFETTHPLFGWLLWIASLLLFSGALFIVIVRVKEGKNRLVKAFS